MKNISFVKNDSPLTPVTVTYGAYSSPVWIQSQWTEGDLALRVQKNGCGHCCTAMALCLHGIPVTPYDMFDRAFALWGAPNGDQGYHASETGIVKVLSSYGVKAEYFCMAEEADAKARISQAFDQGKLVLFCSMPSPRLPNNPFSTGQHFVLGIGYANENKDIMIANSSVSTNNGGVHFETIDTIVKSLLPNGQYMDKTWGDEDIDFYAGYVVID